MFVQLLLLGTRASFPLLAGPGTCRTMILCNANSKLEDYSDVLLLYADDFNQERLATQLSILHSNVGLEVRNLNGGAKIKFIVAFLQSANSVEHELYAEVIKLTKIILVILATNAVRERSFSALRHLKTWLRSTMNQARLNWCMILHIHQDETDLLDIQSVANEFLDRNASRHSIFGVFV